MAVRRGYIISCIVFEVLVCGVCARVCTVFFSCGGGGIVGIYVRCNIYFYPCEGVGGVIVGCMV